MALHGSMIGFIPTRDADLSRRFYEGVLGMRFVSDDTFAIVLDAEGTRIRLVRVGEFTPQRFTVLGWEVAAIAAAVDDLAAAGVRFENYGLPGQGEDCIWHAPGGAQVAWFLDPDGNVLSVSQHTH